MTTIIKDEFSNGATVEMAMEKEAQELFVFHFKGEGKGCDTSRYPLNSYYMAIAWSTYQDCCEAEKKIIREMPICA